MEPILERTTGRGTIKLGGVTTGVILTLLLGLGAACADTAGFTGDFAEAFWTNQVQLGSVGFSNSDTIVVAGPNTPAAQESSFDGILYNGPLRGGLTVGGTVQFNWAYNSGDALSTSEADFAVTPPAGGGSTFRTVLAQGGPGLITSGSFTAFSLAAGTTFEFLLSTDTLANKLSGTLTITSFEFHPDIPEPTTGALLGSVLISLGAARGWRRRRRASGQP